MDPIGIAHYPHVLKRVDLLLKGNDACLLLRHRGFRLSYLIFETSDT